VDNYQIVANAVAGFFTLRTEVCTTGVTIFRAAEDNGDNGMRALAGRLWSTKNYGSSLGIIEAGG
jgi:hypothetical protein